MSPLLRQCILASLICVLFYVFPSQAASSQPDRVHFSNWEFELPPQLIKSEQTGERLVLKLRPDAGAGQKSIVTLYAPQAVEGEPDEWLGGRWERLSAGKTIVFLDTTSQAALMDGTGGLRISANTGNGQGLLQADAYIKDGQAYLMVVEAEGEEGFTAYLTLLTGLRLGDALPEPPSGFAYAAPPAVAQPVSIDIQPPKPLGHDTYDTIDWKEPGTVIRTTADLEEVNVAEELDAFLGDNQNLMGDVQSGPMTFADAMANVRALVGVEKNAAYLDTLRTHPLMRDPDALTNFAVAKMMAGSPPEALAGMLVAHERWPGNTLVMFNLASVLSQYGYVNESQAILGEIKRLGRPPAVASGMSPQSAMDYMNGYNDMRLGQYEDAASLLGEVAEREPYLAEASLAMALLADRLGGDARKYFLKGYYRRPAKFMGGRGSAKQAPQKFDGGKPETNEARPEQEEEIPVEEMQDDIESLPARFFVDLSRGQPGNLPPVLFPKDLKEAIAYWYWYAGMTITIQAEVIALGDRRDQLSARWGDGVPMGPRYERYETIVRIFDEANARVPELKPLIRDREDELNALADTDGRVIMPFMEAMMEIARRHQKEPPIKACPEVKALALKTYNGMLAHVKQADIATRRAHRLWHRYATALGGMVSDPVFREYLKAAVALADYVEYRGLQANLLYALKYAIHAEQCLELERRAQEEAENEEAKLPPCDEKNKVTKGYKLGPIKFEESCDGFTLGVENDLLQFLKLTGEAKFDRDGWLQGHKIGGELDTGFGKVSVEVATDKGGDFVEGKVGGEVSVGPGSVKGEVSRDSKGNTTIYGGKKVGGKVSVGPVKGGASHEEGGGYTFDSNGDVTSTFTKTVTETSGEMGGVVGGSSKIEGITTMPAAGVSRGGAPTLSTYH